MDAIGSQVDVLIENATIVSMNAGREVIRSGFVAVKDGRIEAVGPQRNCRYAASRTIDANGDVVLPGFVNTHSHLIGGFVRGLGGDQFVTVAGAAEDRLPNLAREAMDEEACYYGARLALLEMQRSGVTTTTDSQPGLTGKERNVDGTLRAISESGIRALFTRASHNRTSYVSPKYHDTVDHAIAELDRIHSAWSSGRVEIGAEAQALHRVEESLLRALKEWTRSKNVHFGMHISYSRDAAAHSIERFGRPLLLLMEDWGVLDSKFLGYHPVWLNEEEIAALARTGAGSAYCPVDNMLIASGVAPLKKLLEGGVRLGLGIDQPNDGHNFFELMKLAILAQRSHNLDASFGGPELALEIGTTGGARALHREDTLGSLEAGKQADFIILDAGATTLNPFSARLSNLVYAARPNDVRSVFIGGQAVILDGKHQIWDEAEVIREANRVMAGCLERSGITPDQVPYTSWPLVD